MDGVLADFVASICKAHNRPSVYTHPETMGKSLGLFDIDKIWGISAKDFWAPSNSYEFWYSIYKTEEADSIIKTAEYMYGQENIAILTAPSLSEWCVPGKRDWIATHYPQFKNKIIFSGAKEFLAGPDRILIDDRDKNTDVFTANGGYSVLVPRLWNRRWPIAQQALTTTLKEMRASNYNS